MSAFSAIQIIYEAVLVVVWGGQPYTSMQPGGIARMGVVEHAGAMQRLYNGPNMPTTRLYMARHQRHCPKPRRLPHMSYYSGHNGHPRASVQPWPDAAALAETIWRLWQHDGYTLGKAKYNKQQPTAAGVSRKLEGPTVTAPNAI